MEQADVKVFRDLKQLSQAAASLIVSEANKAIAERDRFSFVLSGGSTPRQLYQMLISAQYKGKTDWSRWHFFFADERLVSFDHKFSNYGMAYKALLSSAEIREEQIHPAPASGGTPSELASSYEADIRNFFQVAEKEIPRFDLILLGMGSDGHTASLFPGKAALSERRRLVVASPPGVLPPQVERLTFTLPLINAARVALFLVAGTDKQAAFRSVRDGMPLGEIDVVPASLVKPSHGCLMWYIDEKVVSPFRPHSLGSRAQGLIRRACRLGAWRSGGPEDRTPSSRRSRR